MGSEGDVERVTVRGIVVPWAWDEERNTVVAVAIEADDEREYIVTASCRVRELLQHCQQSVEAVGRAVVDESGRSVFMMERFIIVKPASEWGSGGDRLPPGDDGAGTGTGMADSGTR